MLSTLVANVSVFFLLGLVSPSYTRQLKVVVGVPQSNSCRFEPQFVSAGSGDSVLFVFSQPGNYSVTQSSFDHPCQKSSHGFNSGLTSIPSLNEASPHITEYTVTSPGPIWFHSESHCKSGMVFAINPVSNDSFTAFQQIAMGFLDSSTTITTVTATSTVVVPGRGTTTSTFVSLSLVPTASENPGLNSSNGARWMKQSADIVVMIGIGVGILFMVL